MAEITTTQSFSDGDTVTATKLNNIQANASVQPEAITNRTAETSIDQANDLLLIYDASATALKKVTPSDLIKAGTASNFPITGNATIGGTLGVTGASTLTGNTTIGGTLGVTGASTLIGNTAVGGTLTVTGAITATSTINGTTIPATKTLVTTVDTQTLTNKTLTSPSISDPTITGAITASTSTINVGSGQIYKDSSGNVGVGTASPSFNTGSGIEVARAGVSTVRLYNTSSTTVGEIRADSVGLTIDGIGATSILRLSTGGGERLRIDSSGRVGIGTASPAHLLDVAATTPVARINATGGGTPSLSLFSAGVYEWLLQGGTALKFVQDTTERLRINSSGSLLVGATSAQSSERLLAQNDSATNPSFIAYSPSATFTGYVARLFADRNTSNSTYNFLSCVRVASAGDVFIIRDSGNAVNTNNSYGAISDIKLKENIENASSQWNDIKSLQVRKFSFKNDEEHKRMLGLVAQEVELISPNLVETVIDRDKDGSDLGTTTKEVKYSVLYMKAVKALQEAMGRIETLEAKVTALEAA
jgi:hypothetical protein